MTSVVCIFIYESCLIWFCSCRSNVHAAGEGKFSTEHRSVTKINSTSELETSQQVINF